MILAEELTTPSCRSIRFVADDERWPDESSLRSKGLRLLEVDGRHIETEQEMLRELARAFSFPNYANSNWDAVDECLRDLEWLPAKGYVLRVRGASRLWRKVPLAAGALVESWLFAAEEWAAEAVPFHLVFVLEWEPPAE